LAISMTSLKCMRGAYNNCHLSSAPPSPPVTVACFLTKQSRQVNIYFFTVFNVGPVQNYDGVHSIFIPSARKLSGPPSYSVSVSVSVSATPTIWYGNRRTSSGTSCPAYVCARARAHVCV
jgi:hypothetical protein